jgi:hypothetical protein
VLLLLLETLVLVVLLMLITCGHCTVPALQPNATRNSPATTTIQFLPGCLPARLLPIQVAAAALLQQLLDTGVLSEADLLAPSEKEGGKKKSWQVRGLGVGWGKLREVPTWWLQRGAAGRALSLSLPTLVCASACSPFCPHHQRATCRCRPRSTRG